MRLTRKRYRALWVIAICTLVSIYNFRPWNLVSCSRDKVIAVEEEVDPVSINHIISNELSDLPQTKRMERAINQFIKKWEIKGASLAISKDGKLIYSKGFGYADKEKGIETDVNNIFRIASVSKLITAVAIMKLAEDGQLSLDEKVFGEEGILNSPYFLDINDKRVTRITIEHLLRHQGGFSARAGDPMFNTALVSNRLKKEPPFMIDDLVRFASISRLVFEPGKGTRYSNLGYLLLSKIIEVKSGMSFYEYLRTAILEPAGCYDIHLARNLYEQKYPNEVRYYETMEESEVASYLDPSVMKPKCYGGNNIRGLYGAGGLVASPTEMLKLVAAIDGDSTKDDILSPQSIKYMTDYHKGMLPIGWMHTNQQGVWWRTGTLSGTSVMLKKQSDGYAWMFVTNTSSWKGSRFPKMIDDMVRQALNTVSEWPERDMFEFDDVIVDSMYMATQDSVEMN